MVSAIKMPSKKTVGSSSTAQQQHPQAARPPSPILIAEGVDPVSVLAGVVEKKARNLEKRKGRLAAMKEEGKELTKDQLQAIDKLPEVSIQLDIVKELQKQFQQLQAEIDKQKKKKDKLDKQQQKAAEREASRAQLKYSFRVQHMLSNLGEHAKERLRQGTSGSVVLTEAQLTNVDDLYHLLNPTRAGNPRYDKELDEATEHIMLLYEGSSKEVANTTYQSLHDVLEMIEASGILDEQQQQDEEEEEEEQDEDEEEGEEDVPPPAAAVVENSVDAEEPSSSTIPEQLPPVSVVSPQPLQQQEYTQPIASVTNRPPEFAGFATENLQPMSQSFVFMHDSAIEHSNPSAPVVVGDERIALSPVENGHPEPEQHKQQPDGKERGYSGSNKYYGNSGAGYSGGRGNRGGRGRGGGYHQQRDGYQRDNGGGRGGWSGAGRYGSGNNYGAKRGGRSNYRNAGYTQSRGGNPKQ